MKRRVPELCRHCAWYRGAGECSVFVELMPRGWVTEDGRCEGYADRLRRRVIEEQIRRYASRQARVTA